LKRNQLEEYSRLKWFDYGGVVLYLEGKISSPEEITLRCCQEQGIIYMADYVLDDFGQLRELRYDRIDYF